MTSSLLQQLHEWFRAYGAGFAEAGLLPPMQRLKYDHCQRVAENARAIAEGLEWPAQAQLRAEAAGLLHDVGRFRQYAQYRTFVDRNSVNHAEYSCKVLAEENALDGVSCECRKVIMDAIRHHNGRDLPPGLPPESLAMLKLVRDADKLDIYEVVDDALRNDQLHLYPEIVLHVDVDGPPSPAVLEGMASGTSIGYEQLKSLADFLLIQLNWVYDINYIPALRLIRQRRVVERIADHLPDSERIRALLRQTSGEVGRRTGDA